MLVGQRGRQAGGADVGVDRLARSTGSGICAANRRSSIEAVSMVAGSSNCERVVVTESL